MDVNELIFFTYFQLEFSGNHRLEKMILNQSYSEPMAMLILSPVMRVEWYQMFVSSTTRNTETVQDFSVDRCTVSVL